MLIEQSTGDFSTIKRHWELYVCTITTTRISIDFGERIKRRQRANTHHWTVFFICCLQRREFYVPKNNDL